jgi:site-specific recombinase XerD
MFLAQRKNGYFFIQFFDPKLQKIRRISTGTKSKSLAKKYLSNFVQKTETEPEPAPKPSIGKLLQEFVKEYLSYVEGVKSPSYIRSIISSFRQLTLSIGNPPINEINPKILDQFIIKRFSGSPGAAILYFRTLKAAFSNAVIWEYLNENPFSKIKIPKRVKSLPIFISEEEFQQILDQADNRMMREIFTVALYTGMRQGEILNMKWKWINFDSGIITFTNSDIYKTKSKKDRVIPMSKKVLWILKHRINYSRNTQLEDYVFYRRSSLKLNENYVSKMVKKIVRKASIDERVHFHTLRHSFASMLVQRGVSLYVVKEILGHEDLSTTQIYSHLQQQNLVDAINLL